MAKARTLDRVVEDVAHMLSQMVSEYAGITLLCLEEHYQECFSDFISIRIGIRRIGSRNYRRILEVRVTQKRRFRKRYRIRPVAFITDTAENSLLVSRPFDVVEVTFPFSKTHETEIYRVLDESFEWVLTTLA